MLRMTGAIAFMWLVVGVLAASGSNAMGPLVEFVFDDGQPSMPQAEFGEQLTDVERSGLNDLAAASTVRISARTCDGFQLGSGFVADGSLFTNRHLVAGATELKVDQPISPVLTLVDRRASGLDLAIGDPVGSRSLEFASMNPEVGSTVAMAGHAGGGRTLLVEGTVQLFDDGAAWGVGGPVMLIDGSTTGGFSGGPVFDRDGRVVGVLQGYSPTVDLTIAIPVESVVDWAASDDDADVVEC